MVHSSASRLESSVFIISWVNQRSLPPWKTSTVTMHHPAKNPDFQQPQPASTSHQSGLAVTGSVCSLPAQPCPVGVIPAPSSLTASQWGVYARSSSVAKVCPALVTPRTVARQAPLSLAFSREEYWSGLPLPSPGDLPDPGVEPTPPLLAGEFFTSVLPGLTCPPSLLFPFCCV